MGWGFSGFIKSVTRTFKKAVKSAVKIISKPLSWLTPQVDIPDFGTSEADDFERGILINKQSNDANIPVVYGTRLVGGTRVFLTTGGGTDNTYLYMALVLCEGEIDSITELRVDDKTVSLTGSLTHGTIREVASGDSNFYKESTSHIRVQAFMGTDSQTVSSVLDAANGWGSSHRLRGLAYLGLRFKWNQDIFTGIPKVQAVVKGKKVDVYDSGLNLTPGQFTTNPAWCLFDYLKSERYGKGLSNSDIDIPSFVTAATVCETQVEPYSGASNINIFDCNAALDTSKKVIDNVRELLKGCRGYLPYSSGKYKLVIESTGTASITLTEDDIIGGYELSSATKNDKYNRVIVSYISPDRNYQVDEVQFPPIDDSGLPSADQHATMKASDGGFLLEGKFDFKTITSPYQAEELAEVILRRSRDALKLQINVGFDAYDLAIGDIVAITHASLGFSAKNFRVVSVTFEEDYTISLSLIEHQDAHYTWATKEQVALQPTTNLPNPFVIQTPASLTLNDELISYNDGTVITRLTATVAAAPDDFVDTYEVEAKQTLDREGNAVTEDFRLIGQGKATEYQLLNVIDGATYEVRARSINVLGVKSSYISETRVIIGSTAIPQDVADFNISMLGSDHMQLSWTPNAIDLDIEFYEIRYSTGQASVDWVNTTNLVQVPRSKSNTVVINALEPPFYLYIKAVDKLKNESANPAIISSNFTRLENYELIQTRTEQPDFAGVQNNTFIGQDANQNPGVTLDTISLFDSTAGNFEDPDANGFFFDTGGVANNIRSTGDYTFNNTFTLDAIYDATFQVQINMIADDPYDLFDLGRSASLFDDARGPFDGVAPSNCQASISVGTSSTSLDDITTFNAISQQGTFTGRYFKFKANLTSLNNQAKPLITGMQVKLVFEKRFESGEDVASGTSTKSISFTNNFYSTPNITVTGQDLSSGDYFVISNKTKTGFDVVFKNSSDTIINKQFDYRASGFGLQT